MSTDVQGGRPLGRFRVLGFPVHIDLTFVLFVGFLGFSQGLTLSELVVWVLVAVVSVLLHELGHAVLARRTGASPAITLMAMGGVTTYSPPRQLSRLESLGISLAGPAVGLVLGGALVLLRPDEDPPGLVGFALRRRSSRRWGGACSTCCPSFLWTAARRYANCCPVNRSPGRSERRSCRSSWPSCSRWSPLQKNWIGTFGLVLAAFLVLANVMQLRGLSAARRPHEVASGDGAGEGNEVLRLLWEGRPAQARAVLEGMAQFEGSSGADADLALHGAVLATTGERGARVRPAVPGVVPARGRPARHGPHSALAPAAGGVAGHRPAVDRAVRGDGARAHRRPGDLHRSGEWRRGQRPKDRGRRASRRTATGARRLNRSGRPGVPIRNVIGLSR